MKYYLILSFSFFSLITKLSAQRIGSHEKGNPVPTVVKPEESFKSITDGDVDLFTGAYQQSIDLGTVSTPTGTKFNLKMSHSSTGATSQFLTTESSIPYGEGWSLNLPHLKFQLSVPKNKYPLNTSPYSFPHIANEFCDDDILEELSTIVQGVRLNIPGVYNGEMVFKYITDERKVVFVPKSFDKYLELEFKLDDFNYKDSVTTIFRFAIARLGDGTIYEFNDLEVNYSNPTNIMINGPKVKYSNQKAIYPITTITGSKITSISNPNLSILSKIKFNWETKGNINFFEEFTQPLDNHNEEINVCNPSEVILKSIDAVDEYGLVIQKLVLNYQLEEGYKTSIDSNASFFYDDMYRSRTVWAAGGSATSTLNQKVDSKIPNGYASWSNWNMIKHAANSANSGWDNTMNNWLSDNPYVFLASASGYRSLVETNNQNANQINHHYIEKTNIPSNLFKRGSLFQIKTYMYLNQNVDDQFQRGPLMDIDLMYTDCDQMHSKSFPEGFWNATNSLGHFYSKSNAYKTGKIFTTFDRAMKWRVLNASTKYKYTTGEPYKNYTSNYFIMPRFIRDTETNIPNLILSIGPSNSDNVYNLNYCNSNLSLATSGSLGYSITYHGSLYDRFSNTSLAGNFSCHAKCRPCEAYTPGGGQPNFNQGPPSNFGVGLPWAMTSGYYGLTDLGFKFGHCNPASTPFCWQTTSPTGVNRPTKATSMYIERVEINMIEKMPLMLSSVILYDFNNSIRFNVCFTQTPYSSYNKEGEDNIRYSNENIISQTELTYDVSFLRNKANRAQAMSSASGEQIAKYVLATVAQKSNKSNDRIVDSFHYKSCAILDYIDSGHAKEYKNFNCEILCIDKVINSLGLVKSIFYKEGGFFKPIQIGAVQFACSVDSIRYYPLVASLNTNDIKTTKYSYSNKIDKSDLYLTPFLYDYGYKNVTVFGTPNPSNSKRKYTKYEFYNCVGCSYRGLSIGPSTTFNTNTLLFGKLKKIEEYNEDNVLIKSTEYEYDKQMAFLNGYHRNKTILANCPYSDCGGNCKSMQNRTDFYFEDFLGGRSNKFEINPNNHSYFIFLKKKISKELFKDLSGSNQMSTNIEEYEYYEADSSGHYKNEGQKIIDSPIYGSYGFSYTEPNWNLYKTTFYSPQNPKFKKTVENIYLYNFLNSNFNCKGDTSQHNWDGWEDDPYIPSYFVCGFFNLVRCHKLMNLLSEIRTTYHNEGEEPIRKSVYYKYDVQSRPLYRPLNPQLDENDVEYDSVIFKIQCREFTEAEKKKHSDSLYKAQHPECTYEGHPQFRTNDQVIDGKTVYDWDKSRVYYTKNPCTSRRWVESLYQWKTCPCTSIEILTLWDTDVVTSFSDLEKSNLWDSWRLSGSGQGISLGDPNQLSGDNGINTTPTFFTGSAGRATLNAFDQKIQGLLSPLNTSKPLLIEVPHRGVLFTINAHVIMDEGALTYALKEEHLKPNLISTVQSKFNWLKAQYHPDSVLDLNIWIKGKTEQELVDFFMADEENNSDSDPDPPIAFGYCLIPDHLLFRSEHEKIDDVVIIDKFTGKYDNQYQIGRYTSFNPDILEIPFHNILNREITNRNFFFQTDIEKDGKGLLTKYYYGFHSLMKICNSKRCKDLDGNYTTDPICDYALRYKNRYLPIRITTGFGRPDSIGINLYYNDNATLKSTLSDQGANIQYQYDGFNRLISTIKNSSTLSLYNYNLWDRTAKNNILDISNQNYIETRTFFNSYNDEGLITRSYIDPFGRKQGTITIPEANIRAQISPTADYTGIMSGEVELDHEDKILKEYKPFEINKSLLKLYKNTSYTGAPTLHRSLEYNFKSEPYKTFDYTIPSSSSHYSKSETTLETGITLQSEISFTSVEWALLRLNTSDQYLRTESRDPDNKKTITYSYLNGKKLADITPMGSGSPLVTLYAYDGKWDLKKVIDPNKLETNYRSNLQGLVFYKQTPDQGVSKYYYDEVGSLVAMQDRSLWQENAAKVRVFTYDHFGRMLMQVRGKYDMSKLCPKCTGISSTTSGTEGSNSNYRPIHPAQYYSNLYELAMDISLPNSSTTIYNNSYGQSYYWLPNMNVLEDSLEGVRSIFDSLTDITIEKHFAYNDLDTKYITTTERHPNLNSLYHSQLTTIANTIPTDIKSAISLRAKKSLGKLSAATSYDHNGSIHEIATKDYDYNENLRQEYFYLKFRNYSDRHFTRLNTGYNLLNKPREMALYQYLPTSTINAFRNLYATQNNYNVYGNLLSLKYSTQNSSFNALAEYDYDRPSGRLKTMDYKALSPSVQVNYIYDDRDRLTTIDGTVFKEDLYYDNNFPTASFGTNVANYNGNINAVETKFYSCSPVPTHFNQKLTYKYEYDLANRLTTASADAKIGSSSSFGSQSYTYQPNGNLASYGSNDYLNGTISTRNYFYNYESSTNKLIQVAPTSNFNSVPSTVDANNRTLAYDYNGNLKTDNFRKTSLYSGRANLPYQINNATSSIYFGYNTADARIFKGNSEQALYYLAGTGVYDLNRDTWEYYPGGIAQIKDNQLHYLVKDHLTNTRAIIDASDACNGASAVSAYDYYPYGKILRKFESVSSRYKSTSHEKDDETGYDDRNARFYDDESLNFLQTDPLAEKYFSWSTYHYVGRNPISIIDPTGEEWFEYKKDGEKEKTWNWHDGATYDLKKGVDKDGKDIVETLRGQKAVVVFERDKNERLGQDGTLKGKDAISAKTTIYGPKGKDDVQVYHGLTVSSDPTKYSMIKAGDYEGRHEQMATSPYGKGSLTYRVYNLDGSTRVSPEGGVNIANGKSYMEGIFFHRTNWSGGARLSSQGCLNIDGREWRDVEEQLGKIRSFRIRVTK